MKKSTKIHLEIIKVDADVNTPITFMAQSEHYTLTELNAIRFFALNLLQSRQNLLLQKEKPGFVYKNSFNQKLKNTRW